MKPSVNPDIYDKDYYLRGGYQGSEDVFLSSLNTSEYCYDYPLRLAEIKPGDKVLDIGCGIGKAAYKAMKAGAVVTGVDYSKDAIEIADQIKSSLPQDEQRNLSFVAADILSFPDSPRYDVIFMLDIVEHLYDWQLTELFAKAARMLSGDGGSLIIHTAPNKWNIKYLYPTKRFLGRILTFRAPGNVAYQRSKYFYDPGMHVNEQTLWSLRRHLKIFKAKVWCEDFSKNLLALATRGILGNHIWAVATNPAVRNK